MNTIHSNPYVGPRTFSKDEGHLFFGREREARDLMALVVSEKLVLFYAQSGAGKSSLINTRLIPSLEGKGFEVLPVARVGGEAPSGYEFDNIYVFNLLRSIVQHKFEPGLLSGTSLPKFLSHLNIDDDGYFFDENPIPEKTPGSELPSWRRALVIDQFEELFVTHPEFWGKREDFFRQVAQAMQNDPNLWVVLVMREDYIASLDPYAHLLPGGLRVRYYMQRLERLAALKAITSPVEKRRPYAEGVAEKLVDDLRGVKVEKPDGTSGTEPGQYVEPVQLQVACFSLWEHLPAEGTQITEKDIREVGDVGQSLGKYYEDRVMEVAKKKKISERLIREWFENELIAPGGIRKMVLLGADKSAGGLSDEVVLALQSDLVRAEKRGGATFYELTHDRLVEPILKNNQEWFGKNLSPLQRQAAIWRDNNRQGNWLLVDEALQEMERWAGEHTDELNELEEQFLEACRSQQKEVDQKREIEKERLEMAQKLAREQQFSARRARRFTAMALLLTVIALVAGIFGFSGMRKAQQQASAAETAQEDAINQKEDAVKQKEEAEVAKARAEYLAEQLREKDARELANLAKINQDKSDLSILLSVEAYNANSDTAEAQGSLFTAMGAASRLRGYLAYSSSPAEQFAFSPDGQWAAVLEKDGLRLWNLENNALSTAGFYDGRIEGFKFSPNGSLLVYYTREGLFFLDYEQKKILNSKPINYHKVAISNIVTPDGNSFIIQGENSEVVIWEAGQIIKLPWGNCVAVSPDQQKIAVFDSQGKITLYGLNGNSVGEPVTKEPGSVTAMAFSQDGNTFALGSEDGTISLIDLKTNRETETFTPDPDSPIYILDFTKEGNLLYQNTVGLNIWEIKNNQPVKKESLPGTILNLTPDATGIVLSIYLGYNSEELTFYQTSNLEKPIWKLSARIYTIAFSPDGTVLAGYDWSEEKIKLLDINGKVRAEIQPEGQPACLAFSSDGKLLAVGAQDGSIALWNVTTNEEVASYQEQTGAVSSLAFSRDGKLLLAGRQDGVLSVWPIGGEAVSNTDLGFTGQIGWFDFVPGENLLYSSTFDDQVILDTVTLAQVGQLHKSMSFDEKKLVFSITDADGYSYFWDIKKRQPSGGKMLGEFQGWNFLSHRAMTADKNSLLLWDIDTGTQVGAPIDNETFGDFCSNGNVFFTHQSDTGSLTLWNAFTGEKVNQNPILEEFWGFSPDCALLVTRNNSKYSFWDVTTGALRNGEVAGDNLVFSADGKDLLIQNYDGIWGITRWDVATLSPIGENIRGNINSYPFWVANREVVLVERDGASFFLDVASGENVGSHRFQGGYYGFAPIFSPDNQFMAYESNAGGVILWNLKKNAQVGSEMIGHSLFQYYYSSQGGGFTSDSKTLVTLSSEGTRRVLWETATGKQLGSLSNWSTSGTGSNWIFDFSSAIERDKNADQWILNADLKTSALFGSDGTITLWNLDGSVPPGKVIGELAVPAAQVILHPDGSSLLISRQDFIEDSKENAVMQLPPAHIKEVSGVSLSPDGKTLAVSYAPDGTFSLWNLETVTKTYETLTELFLSFSPDGQFVVSTPVNNYYSQFSYRKVNTGELLGGQSLQSDPGLSLSANGLLAIPDENMPGYVKIMGTSTGKPVGESVPGVFRGFGLGGQTMITSDEQSVCQLWDIDREQQQISKPIELSECWSLYFSPDAKTAYMQTSDGQSGYIWNMLERKRIAQAFGYASDPFMGQNKYLVLLTGDGEFTLWNVATGRKAGGKPFQGDLRGFNQSGDYIAVSKADGKTEIVKLGDTVQVSQPITGSFWGFNPNNQSIIFYNYDEGGFQLHDLSGNPIPGAEVVPGDSLRFSQNNQIAAVYYDYRDEYALWDAESGRVLKRASGRFIDFSWDGNGIVVENREDNQIELWDTNISETPRQIFDYQGARNGVFVSGQDLFIYGNQGVRVWNLSRPEDKPVLLQDLTSRVEQMRFNQSGDKLFTIASDGLLLWNVQEDLTKVAAFYGESGRVVTAAFDEENHALVYVDSDGGVFSIGYNDANPSSRLLDKLQNSCRISLSSNGKFLAYQSGQEIRIRDVQAMQAKDEYKLEYKPTDCNGLITFSQEGQMLATTEGSQVLVFSMKEENHSKSTLYGETYYWQITNLTFIDENILVVNADSKIFFWDIANQVMLGTSNQHGQVESVGDGKVLVYVPTENQAILLDFSPTAWKTQLSTWKDLLCAKVGRDFSVEEWAQYFPGEQYDPACSK